MILYEYPLHERVRTYLRLEHLFARLGELAVRDDPVDHHYAITTIFEVMDVGGRPELKTEVLKDIEKQKHVLNGYRGNPAISEAALDEIVAQLDACFAALTALPGKVGQSLTENDWLMSIRNRIGIPGGTCEFDLPAYFAWQHLSPERRRADMQRWMASLLPLARALEILLKLMRDSGLPQKVHAASGVYQQSLPQGRTFHLLRLRIDSNLALVPEISANRLLVSVRMLRREDDDRMHSAPENAEFELTLCA